MNFEWFLFLFNIFLDKIFGYIKKISYLCNQETLKNNIWKQKRY
jgi:hypothetical protein